MTTFDKRESGFENKFAHDEQMDFALEAKACKIFGLWVAEQLGLDGDDAKTYAGEVVAANLEEAGFEDVYRKVRPDLEEKGIEISDQILHTEMEKAVAKAREISAAK
jgi:hypothetical protein